MRLYIDIDEEDLFMVQEMEDRMFEQSLGGVLEITYSDGHREECEFKDGTVSVEEVVRDHEEEGGRVVVDVKSVSEAVEGGVRDGRIWEKKINERRDEEWRR